MKLLIFFGLLDALVALGLCSDITTAVFGKELDGMPAAFGDFNSDELTDVFVLSKDGKTVQILLASVEEPLLQPKTEFSCAFKQIVTSVVPGDFDGDVFMDILITTMDSSEGITNVYVLWGGNRQLNCTDESKPLLQMRGQPLAMDYNQDMIIDLFGADVNGTRTFWVFNSNRTTPTIHYMKESRNLDTLESIREPHANAFLDLNNDFYPDLVITTEKYFEIWYGKENGFEFNNKIPTHTFKGIIGQSLHLDVELLGKMDLVLPICVDTNCKTSLIMIYSNGWHDVQVNFKDNSHVTWGFALDGGQRYTDTITMRGGDFNMDGYPDLLATLRSSKTQQTRSFLLENVPCDYNCGVFNRTFQVRWNALNPFFNQSVMAVFYDFYQDGILDVILVLKDLKDSKIYKTAAFKNSLDYDANFVKVMVLTGRTNSMYPISPGSLGRKKRTYGTNLPGPSIAYKTTTQDGSPRSAIAAQLPQSAHFSLNLPFTTFGLGRTPNFIDSLTIGLSNRSREWPQIIPNSQMVVIPNPPTDPSRWKAQLFVTPSKLILLSAAALTGTCGLITAIIAALYWKERREDKIEKLQEAHRFHFDAM
ncbi:PREDICTED: T-cell immunomodulatory protein [Ceratosolen solmsi marchali]|uniref:T-cell immunomodulatory protein n=1 Tax=Ceratosolen solmsi marchali TaxID=326594 RepID=A0AAJ6YMA7_9HYME|nr:PREDICTED: T-cell immunomodulatory protein [Ceratosolen solmsi marchali]